MILQQQTVDVKENATVIVDVPEILGDCSIRMEAAAALSGF